MLQQRRLLQAGFLLAAAFIGGFVFAGQLLDSLQNAFAVVPARLTYWATGVVLATAGLLHVWLKRKPQSWALGSTVVRVKGVGPLIWASVIGTLALLWVPQLAVRSRSLSLGPTTAPSPSSRPPSSSDSGRLTQAGLQVVALDVIDDRESIDRFHRETRVSGDGNTSGDFSILDFKLRNLSEDATVITRLRMSVATISTEAVSAKDINCKHMDPWNYTVLLTPRLKTQNVVVPLAQVVPPHGADRFTITVGQEDSADISIAYFETEYSLQLTLDYNGKDSLNLGTHSVHVRGPACGSLGRQIPMKVSR